MQAANACAHICVFFIFILKNYFKKCMMVNVYERDGGVGVGVRDLRVFFPQQKITLYLTQITFLSSQKAHMPTPLS